MVTTHVTRRFNPAQPLASNARPITRLNHPKKGASPFASVDGDCSPGATRLFSSASLPDDTVERLAAGRISDVGIGPYMRHVVSGSIDGNDPVRHVGHFGLWNLVHRLNHFERQGECFEVLGRAAAQ